MSKFSISVGRNSKFYNHPYEKDVNTTFDFGSIQPVLCVPLEEKESIKGDFKELLRLAPMPCPSFARIFKETYMRFVPYAEICPFYDCIRAKKTFTTGSQTYYPDKVPEVTNRYLVMMLIYHFCRFRIFNAQTDGTFLPMSPISSTLLSFLQAFYPDAGIVVNRNWAEDPSITPDSADFILQSEDSSTVVCCRLTATGARIRKIFIGLGFGLNIQDTEPLSFLPILAYYKAYFDTYSPQRVTNWLETSCYKLIQLQQEKYVENTFTYLTDGNASEVGSFGTESVIYKFFAELGDSFYTIGTDFVSAHTEYPNLVSRSLEITDMSASPIKIENDNDSSGKYVPVIAPNPARGISNFMLQGLQRLARFVNKDSVYGQRLSDWLKVHFGANVANSVFEDSYKIGYYRLDASINDLFSTSDTSQIGGEQLGVYAGKGIGYKDNNRYSFKAPTPGIVIGISCVVPKVSYFQGNDTNLYAVDENTMFFPEYDGMGFEITSYNSIFSDNGYAKAGSAPMNDKGFGYIPRYTGLKVTKNIVNGDMSRRSTLSNMSPYYLDRLIVTNSVTYEKRSDNKYAISFTSNLPPQASEAWRFVTKYPYLGNLYRIFYNSGGYDSFTDLDTMDIDDNFISQAVFDYKISSTKLPISMSYDTYDDKDTSSININKE